MNALAVVVALSCVTAAQAQTPTAASQHAGFRIIVHPENPASIVDRKLIADAFLKRKTSWPDGEAIRPIDLAPDSAVRLRFTANILERTVAQMRSYWQQRIFTGRELPPLEMQNEQDIVKYVMTYRGAVGYVSATTNIETAKVIQIREE